MAHGAGRPSPLVDGVDEWGESGSLAAIRGRHASAIGTVARAMNLRVSVKSVCAAEPLLARSALLARRGLATSILERAARRE